MLSNYQEGLKAKGGERSHARLNSMPTSPGLDYKAAPQAGSYGGAAVGASHFTNRITSEIQQEYKYSNKIQIQHPIW